MKLIYPAIEEWSVGEGLLHDTVDGVRIAGRFGRESGAFWLGRRKSEARVSELVFPRGAGVDEAPGLWKVSPEVFGAVTRWATPRSLCLLAVVHTHVGSAPPLLSWTDRNFGVRVPDVLAIVIPKGGNELNYRRWGWYVFEKDDYRQFSRSEMVKRLRLDQSEEFGSWQADESAVQPLRMR